MPTLLSRTSMSAPSPEMELYVVHQGKDYRVTAKTLLSLVTREVLGLGEVNNTSDLDKPLSIAVRSELNKKLESRALEPYSKLVDVEALLEPLRVRLAHLEANSGGGGGGGPSTPSLTVDQVMGLINQAWISHKAQLGDITTYNERIVANTQTNIVNTVRIDSLKKEMLSLSRATTISTANQNVKIDTLANKHDEDIQNTNTALENLKNAVPALSDYTPIKVFVESIKDHPERISTLEGKMDTVIGDLGSGGPISQRVATLEHNVTALGGRINGVNESIAAGFSGVNERIQQLEPLKQLPPRIASLETRLNGLDSWSGFNTDYQNAKYRISDLERKFNETQAVSIDMYYDHVKWLQFDDSSKPCYGGIKALEAPIGYRDDRPVWKIDPYWASTAVFYVLKSHPSRAKYLAQKWINFYIRNFDSSIRTLYTLYTDGETIGPTYPGTTPPVPNNVNESTTQTVSLFLLAFSEYMMLFGIHQLDGKWKEVLTASLECLKDCVNSVSYFGKHPNDAWTTVIANCEGIAASRRGKMIAKAIGNANLENLLSNNAKFIPPKVLANAWDANTTTWRVEGESGNFAQANLGKVFPDGVTQVFPLIYNLAQDNPTVETNQVGAINKLMITYTSWSTEGLNTSNRIYDPYIAYGIALTGLLAKEKIIERNLLQVRTWAMTVLPTYFLTENYKTLVTCADAGIISATLEVLRSKPIY